MIQYLELSTEVNIVTPDGLSRPQVFQLAFENAGQIEAIGAKVMSVSTQTNFKPTVTLELQPPYAGMHIPRSFLRQGSVCTLSDNYPLEEMGKGIIVRAWFKPALRSSWKNIQILGANKIVVPYKRTFTVKEFERIKLGVIPMAMEDKWFAYFEGDCLFWHRSWTGHGVFEVYFDRLSKEALITKVIANNDPELIKGNPNFASILDDLLSNLCAEAERIFDV